MASLLMFDDIDPDRLPAGYDAYAGYVNGRYPDFSTIRAKFPHAQVLSIDVNGSSTSADCLDVEPGDAGNATAGMWARAKIAARARLIVVYTSVSNVNALIAALADAGVPRSAVKIWSAHYGAGAHICGPATCGLCSYACDGTQFTSSALGSSLDESVLLADFFGNVIVTPPSADPTLVQGDTGASVRTLQTRLNVWGARLTVDGTFGPATEAAVKTLQEQHKLTPDGTVGPQTWTLLNSNPPAPKPPAPRPYPAPLHVGADFSKYPLAWEPVVVNGKAVSDYSLKVVQLDGKVVSSSTVTGTSIVLSKLTSTWHYKVHVSALGGPAGAGVTQIEIIA